MPFLAAGFAYIGTALGASAASATATGVAATAFAATAASTAVQVAGEEAAAKTAKNVANYNAALDKYQANQMDLNTQEDIRRARQNQQVYLSKQRAAIAASGLLESGSPLELEVHTAGRFEMEDQQTWQESQASEESLFASAQAGIVEGAAEAEGDEISAFATALNGGAKVASLSYGNYQNTGSVSGAGPD